MSRTDTGTPPRALTMTALTSAAPVSAAPTSITHHITADRDLSGLQSGIRAGQRHRDLARRHAPRRQPCRVEQHLHLPRLSARDESLGDLWHGANLFVEVRRDLA